MPTGDLAIMRVLGGVGKARHLFRRGDPRTYLRIVTLIHRRAWVTRRQGCRIKVLVSPEQKRETVDAAAWPVV